jgi:hypothetical protein
VENGVLSVAVVAAGVVVVGIEVPGKKKRIDLNFRIIVSFLI